jgi:hypothetical protein
MGGMLDGLAQVVAMALLFGIVTAGDHVHGDPARAEATTMGCAGPCGKWIPCS